MKKLGYLFLALVFIFLSGKPAISCVCVGPENPKEALKFWSDTVFTGRLISIEIKNVSPSNSDFKVAVLTFKVEKFWKNVSDKKIVVRDYSFGSDCAATNYKVDEKYIIFANSKNEKGVDFKDEQGNSTIVVDTCSYTANLSKPRVKEMILNKIGKGKSID